MAAHDPRDCPTARILQHVPSPTERRIVEMLRAIDEAADRALGLGFPMTAKIIQSAESSLRSATSS